jgi:flavin reductase (DIM6/NTAB) family NADH-FMN oxidoreductase RutF
MMKTMIPIEPDQVRQAMRLWTSGVTIITAAHANESHGMTVSSFTSISLEPPLLMAALQKITRTSKLIAQAQTFGVTILSIGQEEISDRFAGRSDESKDRMDGIETEILVTGAPFIKGGLVYFDCRLTQTIDAGTSMIIIGEVVAVKHFDGEPLLYHDRQYKQFC